MKNKQSDREHVYREISGGSNLLEWLGYAPDFHDGEITRVDLQRRARSLIMVHAWRANRQTDPRAFLKQEKHFVVTFMLDGIMDLQLDGFSHQNVIGELIIRRAVENPDRRPRYSLDPSPQDWELLLEPCFGLDGWIRCRKIEIDFTIGTPDDADREAGSVRGRHVVRRRAFPKAP